MPEHPTPASLPALLLITRAGCCLCEGLEEKLRALGAQLPLDLRDVDADPALTARYGLEVPVLLLRGADGSERELPRVSPRLAVAALGRWLQEQGVPATMLG